MHDSRSDFCPYEPEARAGRCVACIETTGGLPPCVAKWLDQEPVDLAVVRVTAERKRRWLPLRRAA